MQLRTVMILLIVSSNLAELTGRWRTSGFEIQDLCVLSKVCWSVLHLPQNQQRLSYKQIIFNKGDKSESYVYWTVHRLDSWIKRDQLDVTFFIISLFNAHHVSDVNTSILRSLQIICWVISWVVLIWFDVYWCYVVVWLWWCGIRMQASACIRIPHHHSQTTT